MTAPTTIFEALPEDHPLVNPELYLRVQKALTPLGKLEAANFDPIKRPVGQINAARQELREKVIAEYNAEKPRSTPPSS